MSVEASAWAWGINGLKPTQKLTMLALADHADDCGRACYPSYNRLAKKVGCHRRTVMRACEELRELGLIDWDARHRDNGSLTSNDFRLNVPWASDKMSPGASDKMSPPSDTGATRGSDTGATRVVAQVSPPEPSLEPSNEPSPKEMGLSAQVREVFNFWKETTGHPDAQLDSKRTSRIRTMLKNYSVSKCKAAIVGMTHSAWHMGENPQRKRYDGITNAFKDADQVESFIRLAAEHDWKPKPPGSVRQRRKLG